MSTDPLEHFTEHHEELLEEARELDSELPGDLEAAADRLEEMGEELERHFREEEEAYFPPVQEELADELEEIVEEHELVTRHFEMLKNDVDFAVEEGGSLNPRGHFANFLGALRSHVYREDEELFPKIEGLLTEEERGEAAERLEDMD